MEVSGLASGVMAACIDQVTLARESAMLGEYATALVYFEGVLEQLGRREWPFAGASSNEMTRTLRYAPRRTVFRGGPTNNFSEPSAQGDAGLSRGRFARPMGEMSEGDCGGGRGCTSSRRGVEDKQRPGRGSLLGTRIEQLFCFGRVVPVFVMLCKRGVQIRVFFFVSTTPAVTSRAPSPRGTFTSRVGARLRRTCQRRAS